MHSRRTVSKACWLATFLVAACTYRHYQGPPLPPAERSAVDDAYYYYVLAWEGVTIKSIDGKRMPSFSTQLELTPGFHYMYASYESHGLLGGERGERDCVIEFEAVAGHDYRIDYATANDEWTGWLRDESTGERVAQCRFTTDPVRSWTPRPTPTPTVSAS
jgi:hypothetical protein